MASHLSAIQLGQVDLSTLAGVALLSGIWGGSCNQDCKEGLYLERETIYSLLRGERERKRKWAKRAKAGLASTAVVEKQKQKQKEERESLCHRGKRFARNKSLGRSCH